jgi:hypothetical protein
MMIESKRWVDFPNEPQGIDENVFAAAFESVENCAQVSDNNSLDQGEDPYQVTAQGHAALQLACQQGQLSIVNLLLDAAPDLIQCRHPECGKMPLHCASFHGHTHVIAKLLCRGANVTKVDRCHRTALEWARLGKWAQAVQLLRGATRKAHERELSKREAFLRACMAAQTLIDGSEMDCEVESLHQVKALDKDIAVLALAICQ